MLRKLLSEEERIKKEEKKKKIIVVIFALIMLLSSAAYFTSDIFDGNSNSIVYNNIKFNQNDYGYWTFDLNGKSFTMVYTPNETKEVSLVLTKTIADYSDKPLYFGVDDSRNAPPEGIQEIANNLANTITKSNYACLNNNCTEDYPVKNCAQDNIIIFKESNETTISESLKCVYINYAPGKAQIAVDSFLYRLLGLN